MNDPQDYHYSRAVAELDAAQRSECPKAVRAHCELAELHLELARVEKPASPLFGGPPLPDYLDGEAA